MKKMTTWYIYQINCKHCAEHFVAKQTPPRRLKKGPRCGKCRRVQPKRCWKRLGSVPARTARTAVKNRARASRPGTRSRTVPATAGQVTVAEYGLGTLIENKLQVTLIPAPEPRHSGHKIRVVTQANPPWYSRMAQARGFNFTGKKKRYGPLRQLVIRCLERIESGWCDPLALDDEIIEEAMHDMIDLGWEPPDDDDNLRRLGNDA